MLRQISLSFLSCFYHDIKPYGRDRDCSLVLSFLLSRWLRHRNPCCDTVALAHLSSSSVFVVTEFHFVAT